MSIKIAVIGAGSLGFTRMLMHDVLTVPELQDTHFAFTDISQRNLDMIARISQRDIEANKLPARLTATTQRRRALEGADYVINTARVGGLEGFQLDVDIPLKYGVDQCVGDTLCAGGIMYGQRGIAAVLDWCRDIRAVANPGVLFLNYGNPNAMLTWAANHHGKVNTIGLCHGVQGGHWMISNVIEFLVNGKGKVKPDSKGFKPVKMEEVDIICAGINHQTWYVQVRYQGQDWTGRLLEGFESHPQFRKTEKVRIDMLRHFGYFTTESNGHVSEYVAWYRKNDKEILKWIDMSSWINGETGGYLRVCLEGRNWFETEFPKLLKDKPWTCETGKQSHEHGGRIIQALETRTPYRGHFNVVNNGCITNLPYDAIVEVPGYVDGNGVAIPRVGDLPLGCAAVCNASISVQRLSVEAAVHGDATLLKQAMLMDPLVSAVCTTPAISQMTDEMLIAQARWLPQYRKEIPKAVKRLAGARRLGTRKTQGAARVKTAGAAQFQAKLARQEKARRKGRPKLQIAQVD